MSPKIRVLNPDERHLWGWRPLPAMPRSGREPGGEPPTWPPLPFSALPPVVLSRQRLLPCRIHRGAIIEEVLNGAELPAFADGGCHILRPVCDQ